jgi:hypothetical protein
MMIDQRRRPATQGGQRSDPPADADTFERVGSIQPPPNKLQNLVKVLRLPWRPRHSGREGGIQMRVTIHEARHEDRAVAFDDLVTLHSNDIRSNANNSTIRDAQIAAINLWRIELNEQRIAK